MAPSELTDMFGIPIGDIPVLGARVTEEGNNTETPFRITDFLLAFVVYAIAVAGMAVAIGGARLAEGPFTLGLPIQAVAYVLGLLVVKIRRRAPGSAFGFPIKLREAWGLLMGLPMMVAITLIMIPITNSLENDDNVVTESLLNVDGALETVMAILGVMFLIPLCEELIFRGVLQPAIRRRTGPITSIVLTALIFGLVHAFNIDPAADQLLLQLIATVGGIFLLALLLGWAREKTGGIGLPFFLHAGWNGLLLIILFLGPEALV